MTKFIIEKTGYQFELKDIDGNLIYKGAYLNKLVKKAKSIDNQFELDFIENTQTNNRKVIDTSNSLFNFF